MSADSDPSPRPLRRDAAASVATRLLAASVGLALAVLLALAAARWYEQPHLGGSAAHSTWVEPDFLCSLASAAVAITVGVWSTRAATSPGAIASGSPFFRVVIWVGLTLLLLLAWADSLHLFTLLVAPAHGFAGLRWLGLWSKWRADAVWNRRE